MPERDYGLADIVQRSGTARAGLLRDLGQAQAQNRLALGAAQAQGYQDQGQRSALLAGSLAKIGAGAIDDYRQQQALNVKTAQIQAQTARENQAAGDTHAAALEAQATAARNQSLSDLVNASIDPTTGKVDRAKLTENATAKGLGSALPSILESFDKAEAANQGVTKARADADKAEMDYAKTLGSQMADANFDPAAVNGLLTLAEAHGHKDSVGQFRQLWESNPDQFKAFVTKLITPPETNADKLAREKFDLEKPGLTPNAQGLTPQQQSTADQHAADLKQRAAYEGEQAATARINANKPSAGAAAGAGLDDAGLDLAAATYRITRSLPSRNAAQTGPIISRAAAQAKALGQTPANVIQRQYATKADSAALDQSVKIATAVEGFEAKALPQADLVDSLSKKVGRTASPLLNKALLAGKADVIGDADTRLLYNAITTFTSEYAKIIEGSTGSAGASSDLARRKSEEMVRSIDSPATVTKLLNQMKYEMSLTRQGWDATIGHINERLGGGSPGEKPPVSGKGDPLGIR